MTWAFALIGWRRTRRERRPAWLLLLPVLYFNISLAFLLALGRYSVPVLPALIVLAGVRRRHGARPEVRGRA